MLLCQSFRHRCMHLKRFSCIKYIVFLFFLIIFADALRIVKDKRYGAKNPDEVGGWDGMVGELVRRVSCNLFSFLFIYVSVILFHIISI